MAQKLRKDTHYYVNKRIKGGNFSFFMISAPKRPQKSPLQLSQATAEQAYV